MIQKIFSEGIYLENEGPTSSSTFKSSYNQNAEKSYITAVSLVPKLVPKRTFFAMNGALPKISSATFNRSCSFSSLSDGEKSYESSVYIDANSEIDDINYDGRFYQNIELEARLVPTQFSETIHRFPKTNDHSYSSTFSYDPSHVKERYLVGLRVEKVREVTFAIEQDESGSFTSSMHLAVADEDKCGKKATNGECQSPDLVNGI
ncbi:hypothetical protein AVEN_111549-1 [Araneus ventricosus]|uniref:Uncharacterized protein n=1 Tax=Araneus ventricosus TaxID=182803 RepID=A0A4Y2P7Y9_ARAVE|nr:hypothetical protein AVEN_157399-1 [Araneus ventricosus]GBN46520.1 hypothetical protein AVEN_111549-1 [Araneus ventricosus]